MQRLWVQVPGLPVSSCLSSLSLTSLWGDWDDSRQTTAGICSHQTPAGRVVVLG